MKIILGFVGQMASGKGTAVKYLKEKYGANTYRFSTALSDILNRLYLPNNRENLQKLSLVLRENFTGDILSVVIAEDVKKDPNNIIAVDGVRRPDDVIHLKNLEGFKLVHIFADIDKRYERIIKRSEKVDDQQKTFEQFKQDHLGEAELQIEEIATDAKEKIDNNGTLEKLYRQLDELIAKVTSNQ